jgi:5-methylcytosine-specific restriction endonuclease McrA
VLSDPAPLLGRPQDYLYRLYAMNSSQARRIWREAIHNAWGHRCAFCDGQPVSDRPLTIDHVRARSRGGANLTANCVSCCRACNQSKGSTDWLPWFRSQPFYTEWREVELRYWIDQGRRLGADAAA